MGSLSTEIIIGHVSCSPLSEWLVPSVPHSPKCPPPLSPRKTLIAHSPITTLGKAPLQPTPSLHNARSALLMGAHPSSRRLRSSVITRLPRATIQSRRIITRDTLIRFLPSLPFSQLPHWRHMWVCVCVCVCVSMHVCICAYDWVDRWAVIVLCKGCYSYLQTR